MSDLSPDTDKLLELARGAGALSDARRAQIKAGLLSQIAAGGALGAAASHATWGKVAWFSSPFAKGISALALLSVVGAGVYVGTRTAKTQSAAPSRAVAVTPATRSASLPEAARPVDLGSSDPSIAAAGTAAAPAGAPPAETASAAPRVAAVSAAVPNSSKTPVAAGHVAAPRESQSGDVTSTDTLAAETSLIRDADQALRAGNAQRALTLLDEHVARFPHGVLEPERSAERMIARCKLGQVDAKTAQSYLASHAGSSFAARLQDACGNAAR
jgi:hypothetical protein